MIKRSKPDVASLVKAILAFGRRVRSENTSVHVTSSASSMLNTLQINGPMPAKQLATEERLQPQSLTRIVKRLEEDGLIVRNRSAEDQRELTISLTSLGANTLDADLQERQRWLEGVVLEALNDRDMALLDDVSRILLKLAFHESDSLLTQGKDMPNWVQYAIFWHLYPLGFVGAPASLAKSNEVEHRLEQLIDWLDYAVELGVSALLLGPIFASSTHGYDTIDHFRIDPRLGDEADFDKLVAAANQRGLRLILDGVFNHVGQEFPLFIEAKENGPASTAASWFHPLAKEDAGSNEAYATFENHPGLIVLNHSNPSVADYVVEVMTHWLDRGVSGFRLDAAYATPHEFWASVLPQVRQSHPESYIFGEVIHGDYTEFVKDTGVDAVTQYELWKAIWSSLNDRNFFELSWALERHNGFLNQFIPLTFIGNHDVTRIASKLDDERHLPHALSLLFLGGGIPCVYYGDEQAFRGIKEERMGGDDAIRPAFPDRPSSLQPDGWSIYRLHQDLIGLRRRNPWLYRAKSEVLHLSNQQIALKVHAEGNRLFIALNLDENQARIEIDGATSLLNGNAFLEKQSDVAKVILPKHGWAVLSG